MSVTRFSVYDSGHNHVVPFVVAVVLAAVVLGLSLAFSGALPH